MLYMARPTPARTATFTVFDDTERVSEGMKQGEKEGRKDEPAPTRPVTA